MTIASDIQLLAPSAVIELFELDTRMFTNGNQTYLHAGVNGLGGNIVWQGITYNAFPIEVEGFERSGKGTLPRPKIRVANITGLVSALAHEYQDLIGAKIVRRRTFAKYLDSVNYPPARNKLLYSNQFNVWASHSIVVTSNATLNPILNGAVDAVKLTEVLATEFHHVSNTTATVPNDTIYTFSIYMKKNTRRYAYIKIRTNDLSYNHYATFDLEDGKYTRFSGGTPYMEAVGNGWYRCAFTFNSMSGPETLLEAYVGLNSTEGAPLMYLGNANNSIYVWGAQLEAGDRFTEYQPVGATYIANPYADPNVHFDDEVWFIDRKSMENGIFLEFELSAAFDVAGISLPRRQCIQNTCTWVYRSAECGYTGGPVAKINDEPTSVASEDNCGKRLVSCEYRFGTASPLPYGAFPGVGLIR